MTSEFAFIDRIRQRTVKNRRVAGLTHGIGDDAAILKQYAGRETLITSDLLIEEIDFRRAWRTPPQLLGHKALAVSLSDIAAMGARPRFALLSIGVPQNIWRTKFLDEFYEGFLALADRYKVALAGGDISRTLKHIIINSIVIGETKRRQAITRSGARPGDLLFVTGALGGASCGLKLIESGARFTRKEAAQTRLKNARRELLLRQLSPEPRVAWGLKLGSERLATAMIDVSDGLSSDLAHLCAESGVGAEIEAALIPIDPLIAEARKPLQTSDALALALNGGEDFELLFTARPRDAARLPKRVSGVGISRIGVITKERGSILLNSDSDVRELLPRGFVHFLPMR
jgi:thiamine-monophosphate kinase